MAELIKESKKEKRDRKKEKKEKKEKKNDVSTPAEAETEAVAETEISPAPADHEAGETAATNTTGPAEAAADDSADADDSAADATSDLEIDLSAATPLSRKKQRLLKKGKLDLDKIARKNPAPRPLNADGTEQAAPSKKSPFGVWIGNLSFETTREDIIRYIVAKTKDNEDPPAVAESDISRVNLPKKGEKIKGFAYVDLPSAQHVASVVALSESHLNGRNLLIKNASSFEGRPEEHGKKALSKNPPSRILFVGNLSFDTTEELLEEHFRACGEIVKIRMATFQDSGKCKGFAFVDFLREDGATAALKSKIMRTFINRPLRLEYGEDRSKRNPKRAGQDKVVEGELADDFEPQETPQAAYKERAAEPETAPVRAAPRVQKRPAERTYDQGHGSKRIKSSVALATAQRASAAIVPSQGKKKTFD